ncbi:MAG: hypothetical protein JSU96_14935, partial [Acidobacteriota bacterium]
MPFVRLIAIVFVLSALVCVGCSQAPFEVWVVDSLTKVFPDDLPPTAPDTTHELFIPRNGHGSFQVAVRPLKEVENFTIELDTPTPFEATLHQVGTVTVRANTPDSEAVELIRTAPGEFPDPLFETIPDKLSADRTEVFWVSVYVPSDAEPGDYEGTITIRSATSQVSSLPFSVKVSKARVPEVQTLKVTNWFSTSQQHFENYYPLEGDRENYWKVMENIG